MRRQRTRAQLVPHEVALWISAAVGVVLGVILKGVAAGQLGDGFVSASDAYWNTVFADLALQVGTLAFVGALILGGLRHLRDRLT